MTLSANQLPGRAPDSRHLLGVTSGSHSLRRQLRAGPVGLVFDAGDLRYLKLGDCEMVRRIYAAVRDRDWDTVPPEISDLTLEISEQSFHIAFTSTHRQDEIHFVWRADVTGDDDGSIQFTCDGEARSTFLKNRLGICVLHPIRECAGRPCRVEQADGRTETITFPKLIAPEQPMSGFQNLRALSHELKPGIWAELRLEGDLFETEDQRNWIDASFKTYCTPLHLPFPVEVKAGTRIRQSVSLRLRSASDLLSTISDQPSGGTGDRSVTVGRSEKDDSSVTIVLDAASARPLPPIGLCAPSHSLCLMEQDAQRLESLNLAHLRVDLRMADPHWRGSLWLAAGSPSSVERLELALHFPNVSPAAMKEVARELSARHEQVVRVIIFQDGTRSTPEKLLSLARKHLAEALPRVPVGAGTNADFHQLNQFRPPHEHADFICWSMNPQVHASGNASVAETPEAVADQIASAQEFFSGLPLVVSPVTLKPRFNPVATGSKPPPASGELPPQVDPRQMSLFGAAWTLAMLKHLAEAGAASVTLYETTGWRGVMETAAGSPVPDRFPSIPGAVFPLFHVVADASDFAGGQVIASRSGDPLKVQSLALRRSRRRVVLLANLTAEAQRVVVRGFAKAVGVRLLDESSALSAMTRPEEFRTAPRDRVAAEDGAITLALRPGAVARLDADH